MPRGYGRAKPVRTQYFSLMKPSDMTECGEEMMKHGYSCGITGHIEPDRGGVWVLQLHSPTQEPVQGHFGEVITWDTKEVRVISQAEHREKFDVEQPT